MSDRAKNTFLMESRELLDNMETALLNLESDPEDKDIINDMFRSAHTIKGTAGIFGFDDVEAYTHVLENLMEALRARQVKVTPDLIALLLSAKDYLGLLVEEAVLETTIDDDHRQQGEYVLGELTSYLEDTDFASAEPPKPAETKQETKIETTEMVEWKLELHFKEEVFRNGLDPRSFFHYLAKLGEIKKIEIETSRMPRLEMADPEVCYLSFLVILKSKSATRAEIERVFEFVKEDCEIVMVPPVTHIWDYVKGIEKLPAEIYELSDALLSNGNLSLEEMMELIEDKKVEKTHTIPEAKIATQKIKEEKENNPTKIRKAVGLNQLKVDADKLDVLINLVGELVIAGATTNLMAQNSGDSKLLESISSMSRLVEEIRDSALRLRMVQIGETFSRFQRVVRDLSRELNKDIELTLSGGETELDKTMIEKIGDPLMHLVRNAIDHGIEQEDERIKIGKSSKGSLKLNAFHDSGSIVIQVIDDGKGLDRDKIFQRAVKRGLLDPNQEWTDSEIYRMIFEPGFSTAEKITNLSGRGVGMDVVKKNIESLRGTVDIDTNKGTGTIINIRLPLTLAIIDGFLVEVGESTYVIPLDMVVECIELSELEFGATVHNNYINLRGKVLPFLKLGDLFGSPPKEGARENIVVVQTGGQAAGLVVDNLLGEFQTVIKPLGKVFENLKGVSGSTILGSGEVAVILDVPGLVHKAVHEHGAVSVGRGDHSAGLSSTLH
ncbi:MAG: chemotaxis protein CheA [Gammaproteobacteria bacterium]|nr:chemotaxis protein CheA [Gammaproteobacteria bacterium]